MGPGSKSSGKEKQLFDENGVEEGEEVSIERDHPHDGDQGYLHHDATLYRKTDGQYIEEDKEHIRE